MNVYSIVPSQRSQATVSMRNSNRMPRYAQTTAPMSSVVIVWLTSSVPPVASMPFAMKTIVSVFATVQTNHATSHQM
jgi:hypothetical protein